MDKDKIVEQITNNEYRTEKGLTNDMFLFVSTITPLINVDLLIMDENGRILLSWRDDEHCGTGWHIPGSIIRHGESILDRLHLCATEEIGADIEFGDVPVKISEIFLDQDERNHFISLLFQGHIDSNTDISVIPDNTVNYSVGDLKWFDAYPDEGIVYSQEVYRDFIKQWLKVRH